MERLQGSLDAGYIKTELQDFTSLGQGCGRKEEEARRGEKGDAEER